MNVYGHGIDLQTPRRVRKNWYDWRRFKHLDGEGVKGKLTILPPYTNLTLKKVKRRAIPLISWKLLPVLLVLSRNLVTE